MKDILNFILFGYICCFAIAAQGFGQKTPVYVIPPNVVSHVLVSDINSPIQLSEPKFVRFTDGRSQQIYTISNISSQAVKNLQIVEKSWFGTSERTRTISSLNGISLLPNESISTLTNEIEYEFINNYNKDSVFWESLGLDPNSRLLWILLVTHVELADGTVYNARSSNEKLYKYIDQLKFSQKPSTKEFHEKETELREFVGRLGEGKNDEE